jgi:hypothetical protein
MNDTVNPYSNTAGRKTRVLTRKLTLLSAEKNRRALANLRRVMARHNLRKSHVAYLLDVDRRKISQWFAGWIICPENAPDLLRAICEIRDPESWRSEIKKKRHESYQQTLMKRSNTLMKRSDQ